jgi:hypothetical protein
MGALERARRGLTALGTERDVVLIAVEIHEIADTGGREGKFLPDLATSLVPGEPARHSANEGLAIFAS